MFEAAVRVKMSLAFVVTENKAKGRKKVASRKQMSNIKCLLDEVEEGG